VRGGRKRAHLIPLLLNDDQTWKKTNHVGLTSITSLSKTGLYTSEFDNQGARQRTAMS
jgi:hypothetical protein